MPGSRLIDVAIGLVLVFAVTAAMSSVITELLARLLGLRGTYLLRGLRELLDGGSAATTDLSAVGAEYTQFKSLVSGGAAAPAGGADAGGPAAPIPSATGALLGGPILQSQGMVGSLSDRQLTLQPSTVGRQPSTVNGTGDLLGRARRSLPAYIASKSFAQAVVDLVLPDADGVTKADTAMATIKTSVDGLPDAMQPFKSSLQVLAKNAGDDAEAFRSSVEHWYDDHMGRVSGWYKRRVAKITLVVGAVLVLLLNVNALVIARTLFTDDEVRSAVSGVATNTQACPPGEADLQACLQRLEQQLSDVSQVGLPVGWATVRACEVAGAKCGWWQQRGILDPNGSSLWRLAFLALGYVLTITALVPGARFWFDVLGKLGSLRTSGPRPPPAGQ